MFGTYLLIYGLVALSHIVVQMVLGDLEYRRERRRVYGTATPSVTVVVPAYNEDPALLHRCLLSIDRQDYPDIEVIVIDDGSANVRDVLPVHDDFGSGRFQVLLQPRNTGKRNCQAVVFAHARSEIVVTIDSDTVLDHRAIRTIVRRFDDPRVGAVSGSVEAINQRENLLTRLIAYRYWTAFNQERAAQSYFGVVLCASGPFSAYRRSIIDEVRERYVGQRFLGQPCTFGDDRHLTNLVLRLGHRVVYDAEARAHTHVPATLGAYVRQQTRWNKSFYRELLWTARFAHRRHGYMGIDLALQTVMPFALIVALAATAYTAVEDPSSAWGYLAVLVGVGLIRALYGILRTGSLGFLLFTLYGFLHIAVLLPVRIYALATVRQGHWGTREASTDNRCEITRQQVIRARSTAVRREAESAWAADIRRTMQQDDAFELHWQPVRHFGSAHLPHAEVLLRLRHDGQTIPPAGFLSIAENHDLMCWVDSRVVREVVALLAAPTSDPSLRLEVNVSADAMQDRRFGELIADCLRAQTVAPERLVLSVPVAVASAQTHATAAFSARVRALGCRFALDGYDGGVDDLSWDRLLNAVAPDYVKVGQDLVRSLLHDSTAATRLERLVASARAHHFQTIAVFVGDAPTLRMLQDAGVGAVQGFFIGSPAPVTTPLDAIVASAAGLQSALAA